MLKHSHFNYTSFLEYVTNTPRHTWNSNASEIGTKSFTLTWSYQEAYDYAKHWWDAWIKMLKDEDTINIQGQMTTELWITWAYVNVTRYLSGQPDCMVNFIDTVERDKPRLVIYIPLAYAQNIEAQEAQEYLKKALTVIYKKLLTHDVKVVGYFLSNQTKSVTDFTTIILKDHWQQVVLNNFAFAFHPSFFRRLWFRYIETKDYWHSSYWTMNTETQETLKKLWLNTKDETHLYPQVKDGFSEDMIVTYK